MAGTLNKVMLIGYVGRDPEIGMSGRPVCRLSVATAERWIDSKSRTPAERTDWHRVIIFNETTIRFAQRFVRSGSKVYVEGQLVPRDYESNGEKRRVVEVVVSGPAARLQLMDKIEQQVDLEEGALPTSSPPPSDTATARTAGSENS